MGSFRAMLARSGEDNAGRGFFFFRGLEKFSRSAARLDDRIDEKPRKPRTGRQPGVPRFIPLERSDEPADSMMPVNV